jgi:hypothetical protein
VISLLRREGARRPPSTLGQSQRRLDRALIAAGLDSHVVASVRHDLEHEFEQRLARDGSLAARQWYAREEVCSLFALARYALTSSQRTQISVAATVLTLAATALFAMRARPGAPDRILLNMPTIDGALIVNVTGGEQIRTRIVDARGHQLMPRDLRFHTQEGRDVSVSPTGRVECRAIADATVSVSLGDLETNIPLACRPVRTLFADRGLDVIAGGNARPLRFDARDANGNSVREVRGSTRIEDTTIVTVTAGRVLANRAGQTAIDLYVGNQAARIRVVAHRLVEQFTNDPRDSQFQAVPVRLAPGESHRWSLPPGALWLTYVPNAPTPASPLIEVSGARCSSSPGHPLQPARLEATTTHCIVAHPGANVTIRADGFIEGALAIEWEVGPRSLP